MRDVYILESLDSEHFYVGITEDLRARLAKHNAGEVPHTSKYGPWRLRTYIAFSDEKGARGFEKYLSSPAGHLRRSISEPPQGTRTPNSPNTAFSRSRSATISFFIATSSPTVQADAARIDCGTALAFSRSASPFGVSAISTCRSSSVPRVRLTG